ncbi:MAG: hypothetical protein H7A23_09330 [Leptospiraceae bacterium]|nr:hypothetical protein [Leptospiraceae bacterium]MCP5494745.1 hypothetical protein [Leptospiraceae bacterium]
MNNEKESIEKELWNLSRKADQTRSMHGMIAENLSSKQRFVLIFITIGSAISAMLIFSKLPNEWELLPGFLSAVVFIVSLLPSTLEWNKQIQERELSLRLWGDWVREAQNFGNTELPKLTVEEAQLKLNTLNEKYRKVMEQTIPIPDSKFVKLKQRHLQKVELSKAVSKNPFKTIKSLKRELMKKFEQKCKNTT